MSETRRRTLVDKLGCPFEVGGCGKEDYLSITKMYRVYFPEAVTLGLPPTDRIARRIWIKGLLETGHNFLAWRNGEVAAHSALMPDMGRLDGEYLIFVGRPHRKRGIATCLTEMVIDTAREIGLKKVWLTVGLYNFTAIKLYTRIGFTFRDKGMLEREMALEI
jgi:GNAT superfamily N-acetyltransferase